MAEALGFSAPLLAGALRRASGHAVPGAALSLPNDTRDGRLPRVVRRALRAARAHEHGRGHAGKERRALRRDGRYEDVRGRQRGRGDRRHAEAGGSDLRPGARPEHHATPLERLPQPLAASGGACPGGRRESLGCRHRARGSCRARDDPVGKRHRPDPCVGRDPARAGRSARALLRRLTRADDGHAARAQDASARQARRCAAAAVPEEGSARRGSRARLCAYRRRAGRPAGARRRPRPRRSERDLVHRLPSRLHLDQDPARAGRGRLSRPVPRRRRLGARPLLRGDAVPALVRVDAHLGREQRCRARRKAPRFAILRGTRSGGLEGSRRTFAEKRAAS